MKYIPKVNDYVIWTKGIQGWVYFTGVEYITIETSVKPKDSEDYKISPIHANNRLLVLCYRNQWHELQYMKTRKSVHEE